MDGQQTAGSAGDGSRMTSATSTSATSERGRALRDHATAMAHVPRLVTQHDARSAVHGTSVTGRFNSRLAVLITRAVGTMWAAYAFVVLSLISFPQALDAFRRGDTLVGITWVSQSFLQLVLLPIIIVGQNVISAAQDARAEADHETLTALHTINVRQLQLLEQQERILELLRPSGSGAPGSTPSSPSGQA